MFQFTDAYWWLAALVCLGLAGYTYFYYRRTIPPLKKSWRIGLAVTRASAVVLLLLALAETLLSFSPQMADPPVVVGLVDGSASMFTPGGERTSFLRARDTWHDLTGRFPDAVEAVELFAAESLLAQGQLPDSGGQATAVGLAFTALKQRYASSNLAAVFLFSDGNNNLGQLPEETAPDLGIPIIAVGMGHPDTGLAPHIAAVRVEEVVLANTPFSINVDVSTQRPGNLHLRLLHDERQIGEQTVRFDAAGRRVQVDFMATVTEPGIHNFRIEPGAQPDAGRSFFVKALREKNRVLLFGFRPDWEFSFLNRTLAKISRVEVTSVLQGIGGRDLLADGPRAVGEWQSFDIIILVGPPEGWLKSTWAPVVQQIRGSGKGVMVFLGETTFSAAKPALPYPLEFVQQSPLWRRGEFPLAVDGRFLRHPLLSLAETPDESRRIFESFPPFAASWQIRQLPPAASVPLFHRSVDVNTPNAPPIPLVWTRNEAGAKALVINGGPLWRWSFNDASEPGSGNYYQQFLLRAVRWLSVIEDLDKQRIVADKEIYAAGEPVQLRGLLYDDGYNFLPRASVVAHIRPDSLSPSADSASAFLPPGGGDFYEATVTGLRPGVYDYFGRALIDNDTLMMTGGKLKVEVVGLEKTASGLNEPQMRAIAAKSGGRYYHETEPIAAVDSLTFTARTYTVRREIEIWNQSWLLLAIIVLFSGEWFFRKRGQLL